MYSLNKVQLIGNLTADPELKEFNQDSKVCNFSVATSRKWKNNGSKEETEVTEFHPIVVWGKLAAIAKQYLKKGKKVYVEGRLETRSWEDDNGVKKYKTSIVVDQMIMLSPRDPGDKDDMIQEHPEDNLGAEWSGQNPNAPATETTTAPVRATIPDSPISIADVPF